MPNDHCPEFEELLVDFADGELQGDEQLRMRVHVAQCPGCRDLLMRLDESLVFAKCAWEGAQQQDAEPRKPLLGGEGRDGRQRRTTAATVGVAGLITAATVLLILLPRLQVSDTAATRVGGGREISTAGEPKSGMAVKVDEEIDIERLLHEQEQAARLNAVVEILADMPELADVRAQTQQYLQEHYADW